MLTEIVGWAGALVLLATICRQVYTQWREPATRGVSRWLFVGQFVASTLFLVYSVLLANWVFAVTNALLLLAALVGELIFLRNRRAGAARSPGARAAAEAEST